MCNCSRGISIIQHYCKNKNNANKMWRYLKFVNVNFLSKKKKQCGQAREHVRFINLSLHNPANNDCNGFCSHCYSNYQTIVFAVYYPSTSYLVLAAPKLLKQFQQIIIQIRTFEGVAYQLHDTSPSRITEIIQYSLALA